MNDNDIWVLYGLLGGIWFLLFVIAKKLEKIADVLEQTGENT